MGLKLLMENLKKRAADTPDTFKKSAGYRRKAPIHAGCTPETCDTSCLSDLGVNALLEQFGEAVNDSALQDNLRKPKVAVTADPDLWRWPHTIAMNGAEIDLMVRRLDLLAKRGIADEECDTLADRLMRRDRDLDDRRLCIECRHCHGSRCSHHMAVLDVFQRCDYFDLHNHLKGLAP